VRDFARRDEGADDEINHVWGETVRDPVIDALFKHPNPPATNTPDKAADPVSDSFAALTGLSKDEARAWFIHDLEKAGQPVGDLSDAALAKHMKNYMDLRARIEALGGKAPTLEELSAAPEWYVAFMRKLENGLKQSQALRRGPAQTPPASAAPFTGIYD
jgi:hypothetical protein